MQQPPHMQQPQYGNTQSSTRRIGLNLDYLCSIVGLLQLNIIVILFCAIISIAAVPQTNYLSNPRSPTESAYLFFGIIAFLVEITLFILFILSICEFEAFKKIPVKLIICIKNLVLIIILFALAIAAAVMETQERNGTFAPYNGTALSPAIISQQYNAGAFAAGSFFGFVLVILYVGQLVAECMDLVKERKSMYQ